MIVPAVMLIAVAHAKEAMAGGVRYFLVATDGFNCKNQAVEYIKDPEECKAAAEALGVESYDSFADAEGSAQKYCGTSMGMKKLTFNDGKGEVEVVEYATESTFQICKEKPSHWPDETCGRELCLPDFLKTDDPKVFDLSNIDWYWGTGGPYGDSFWPGGAWNGYPKDQWWRPRVSLFNMTTEYLPHFHKHTYFHSGWILGGAKSTFELDGNEFDPKWTKPVGTYFSVAEGVWHTEKLEDEWCLIYLRFATKADYIWPDAESNQKYVLPSEARLTPNPPDDLSKQVIPSVDKGELYEPVTVNGVRYFLVDTEGFNCKNQAVNYIKDPYECKKAAKALGIKYTDKFFPREQTQKYCGTSHGMKMVTFNDRESGVEVAEYATETSFQICKEKHSPWADETCGRELCLPDVLRTSDAKKFDLSQVQWYWGTGGPYGGSDWPGGAWNGYVPGQPWREFVSLFNMTKEYLPHFHKHTYFHSGWILGGAKSTFELDGNEFDPKWTKPVGTYFSVEEGIWHTEKLEDEWCLIYLRFVTKADYIWPDAESNQKYVLPPEDRLAPYPPNAPLAECVMSDQRWQGKARAFMAASILECYTMCAEDDTVGTKKCSGWSWSAEAKKPCRLYHKNRRSKSKAGHISGKKKCHPYDGKVPKVAEE